MPPQLSIEELNRSEHLGPMMGDGNNVDLKKVGIYAYDAKNSIWQRVSGGLFPLPFDELVFTNPDGNDNYQTITSKLSGSTQNVLALTFDASSNVTDIHRTT